jgi:hypothetical protein
MLMILFLERGRHVALILEDRLEAACLHRYQASSTIYSSMPDRAMSPRILYSTRRPAARHVTALV